MASGGISPCRAEAVRTIYADDTGILRWTDTREEIALWGVNYYTPFTVDYSGIKHLGLDHKKCIDDDTAHFVRMGLDVLRLHVFDREISDKAGNLVDNPHLELLDYLLHACKRNGLYVVLTPIAWWSGSWWEGGKRKEGFSSLYSKPDLVMKPEAWAAQTTYLRQFMNHTNRYTGLAYKDDPVVIAIELINEVTYSPEIKHEHVVSYIRQLANAVRATGAKQPIFYNGWQGREAAVRDAEIEGCSFGWYPTGLVAGHTLRENFLPRVDDYPRMRIPELEKKAKIVYEFDAADVAGSYMYPAMARAFRSGGAQIATQFQYDPLALAPWNYGWQTHYLNLVYTPAKAVSFIIAGEAFRRLPRLADYGVYPKSTRFGAFRVSYEEDLSELVTDEVFMYSNNTSTAPQAPHRLRRIVGCGSSPVVQYPGTGAYFFDRLSEGLWRVEVYPDAVWVSDPFAKTSLEREVSRVLWRPWPMRVRLPDLGQDFSVEHRADQEVKRAGAVDGQFQAGPGVYVLRAKHCRAELPRNFTATFIAPADKGLPPAVRHDPPERWLEEAPLTVIATVASTEPPGRVTLYYRCGTETDFASLPMTSTRAYEFTATLPGANLRKGTLKYWLEVELDQRKMAFPPSGAKKLEAIHPTPDRPTWSVEIAGPQDPVPIFRAQSVRLHGGAQELKVRQRLVPGMTPGSSALRIEVDRFGPPPSCVSFSKNYEWDKEVFRDVLSGATHLVIRARAGEQATTRLEIVLIEQDGAPWGTNIGINTRWQEIRVPLNGLRYFAHWRPTVKERVGQGDRFHPRNLQRINVCFGAWLFPDNFDVRHAIEIEEIALAK